MENLYNYSDSEMLTLLLDGELEAEAGQDLLKRIEIDPELTKQMESEMQIKEICGEGKYLITPPNQLTNELFEKLGYAGSNMQKPVALFSGNILKRSFVGFVALFSILTTAFLYYSFIDSPNPSHNPSVSKNNNNKLDINSTNVNQSNKSAIAQESQKSLASIPAVKTTGTSKIAVNTKINETNRDRKSIPTNDDNNLNLINTSVEIESDPIILYANLDFSDSALESLGNLNNQLRPSIFTDSKYKVQKEYFGTNKILIRTVNPISNDPMVNGYIGFEYLREWKNGFNIGLSLGYENFNKLSTSGVEKVGNISYAALMRYDVKALSIFNINPYAQAQIGFGHNINNLLWCGTLGFEYCSSAIPFGLQCGYEYRVLNYNYGGGIDTKIDEKVIKSGFTLGIIYKF